MGEQRVEILSGELHETFIEWHSGLPKSGHLLVSLFGTPNDEKELQICSDNSQDAFCSVVFLRGHSIVTSGAKTAFDFEKARVAPMKIILIYRA